MHTLRLYSEEPHDAETGRGQQTNHQPPPGRPATPQTVRDVVHLYLTHNAKQYGERSLHERRRVLERFVSGFGDRALDSLTAVDLADWLKRQRRWKSQWTQRMAVQIVQRPFNWAVHMRLIEVNPLHGFSVDEGEPRRPMTDAEFRASLRNSDALFRRVLMFLRYSGCRPGEMSLATWPDVDWQRGCVILERHKSRKKTRKPRVIPLTPFLVRLLRWLWKQTQDHSGLIFLNTKGNAWNRCNLSIRMQKIRYRAGLPKDCFLYGTRHAFGTQGVLNGANLKLLSKSMGHSSVTTLEKYYVHVDQEIDAMREASEKAGGKKPPKCHGP